MTQQPDQTQETGEIPNPQTGMGIAAVEPSTFQPEEDHQAVAGPGRRS